jgi:hypothetical protein
MEVLIEKGIPIPEVKPHHDYRSPIRLPFETMELGDSFALDSAEYKIFVQVELSRYTSRYKGKPSFKKFKTRTLPEGEGNCRKKMIRVWRIA